MTLLTIAQSVADETKGARPATIAGNADPAAQQYLRLINKVGTRLMKIFDWNILKEEHAFSASGNETLLTAANMPSDFNRFITECFWNRSSNNLMSGPITSVEWNGLKVQSFTSENEKFIFRGGAILTQPIVDTNADMAFEYVSKNWVDIAAGGTPKASMTIDTDVTLLDEEMVIAIVKYEWLKDEGQPYKEEAKEAKDALDMEVNNDSPTSNVATVADIFAQNNRHFDGIPKASRIYYGNDF
ncbi:MAG: hypothetical protein KAI73_04535 [Rhodospirillaceae bacterium]|nr:hypothetical protein [Rhodospirillaceae bacterium]